jgi:hypothetical protein
MDAPATLSFETFWQWLATHPNCIIRAGTPEAVLYDDDDLHWHFVGYQGGLVGIQLLRGKRFVAELFVDPEPVSYVQGIAGESEGEYIFELISETETDRTAICFFILAHGYEEDEVSLPLGRVH